MNNSLEKRMVELREELKAASKDELIDRIIKLEKHTYQLRNVIKKASPSESKVKKNGRGIDFTKYSKRHILLRFYYLGWDYQGFATQEDTIETIEHHMFKALQTTCMIQDRESSNYHRCGRTDKGVSAFHQVISIDVRSSLSAAEILTNENVDKEIQYCAILNRVLPPKIRCVAWMPLRNPQYSARFDCKQRTYRYFFPKGDLDLTLMLEGAQHLLGAHDFRNLCKMDINNGVTTFIRNIRSVDIVAVDGDVPESENKMFYIELMGQAFLWHQIRCIVTVLFLVGQGLEKPDIVKELLDVEKNPSKPNFQMANFVPLNLYKCEFRPQGETREEGLEFDSDLTTWVYDEFNMKMVIETLQGQWSLDSVKAAMMKSMLTDLSAIYTENFPDKILQSSHIDALKEEKSKSHKPLLERQKCQSLHERLDNLTKKRKIIET